MFTRDKKMMNVVAMWMLLSSLGAAMVMSPEPLIGEPGHPLKAAKDASRESIHQAAEAARKTGEGIRHTVVSGVEKTGDAAHSVMDAVKDTSQAGLEKVGLASPELSNFEQWEMGLQAAKDKAATTAAGTRDSLAGASDNVKLTAQEKYNNLMKYGHMEPASTSELMNEKLENVKKHAQKDPPSTAEVLKEKYENVKKYGQTEPPSTTEIMKEKVSDAYDATKEFAGDTASAMKSSTEQAAEGVKDTVVGAGQTIQNGAHHTYKTAEEAAVAAKESAENAAERAKKGTQETLGIGKDRTSKSAESVSDLAQKIAQSVQDNIHAAGSTAHDAAGSVKDSTYNTMGTAYEYAADALKDAGAKTGLLDQEEESSPSYAEKLKLATEQAAEILRNRGNDAVAYMPNVGQGLSMGGKAERLEDGGGVTEKVNDYIDSVKDTAGQGYENSKQGASGFLTKPSTNWREEFLNKVGIREEADLSKYDILVGSIRGFWSGSGIIRKAGESLSSATTGTQQEVKNVKHKVSNRVQDVGEHIRNAKDAVMDKARHLSGKASHAVHETENSMRDAAGGGSDSLSRAKTPSNDTLPSDETYDSHGSLWRLIAYSTASILLSSIRAGYLFAFSSTYGASLWVTFLSGYLLSRSIPRQQFGFVQSKMFPVYLRLIGSGQAICLVLYMILHPWNKSFTPEKLQYFNLWGILVSTLVNAFFLEPRATKVMFEKLKVEKEEGRGQDTEGIASRPETTKEGATTIDDATKAKLQKINHKFSVLHGYSSLVNLLGLIGETWHLWHLSRKLVI